VFVSYTYTADTALRTRAGLGCVLVTLKTQTERKTCVYVLH